jgi:hypothetical protein
VEQKQRVETSVTLIFGSGLNPSREGVHEGFECPPDPSEVKGSKTQPVQNPITEYKILMRDA